MRRKKQKELRKIVRPKWDAAPGTPGKDKRTFKSVMRSIRRAFTRGELKIKAGEVITDEKRKVNDVARGRKVSRRSPRNSK